MQGEIRKVAGHSATYALGVVAGGLGRVFLIPIVARFLTADEYGIVALVLAFVSLVGILMDLGLATSLIKFFSEAPDQTSKNRVVSTILLSGVLSGIVIALLLAPLGRHFSSLLFQRPDYTRFVYLGLVLALVTTLYRITLSYYQALPAPSRYAAASVVKGALAIGAAAWFVIHLGWGPIGFVVGTIVPPAALALLLGPAILRGVGLGFDTAGLRRSLRFGVPLVPSTFALWGLTYCDIYLLGRLATLKEVGWYQMGQEICLGMGLVVMAVQLAWPRFIFSHAKETGAPRVFALCADYYAVALGFVGLGLSVFAHEIILVIGSEAYLPAATVIPALCLATFLFALYGVFASGVQIKGRTEFMALTTAGGLIVNVILNVWMIPRWGMIGAALASVLANVVMCGVVLRVSGQFYSIPFSAPRLGGILALAIGLFAASGLAGGLPGLGWMILAKIALVLLFPTVVVFGFFTGEERSRIRSLIRDLYNRGA
jgi:O-antigen/teichoic acid export membrane protein